MQKIFVTPAEGLLVRREDGKPLDPAGEAVSRSAFWLRRERDGDVTIGEVPAVAEQAEAPAAGDQTAPETAIAKKKAAKA